jgi:cell division protein FtsX
MIGTGGMLLTAAVVLAALLFIGKVPLRYNTRNLTVRWRITLLTALAFTTVVGLLCVMLAFVNGMAKLAEGSGQPGNVMVLSDGATDELFSNLQHTDFSNVEREAATTDEDGKPLAAPIGVATVERNGAPAALCSREVYVIVNQPIPVAPGQPQRRRFVQVRGIVDPDIAGRVHNLSLLPGGAWFSDAGVQPLPGSIDKEQAIQAVIGQSAAKVLGPDSGKLALEVNDVFELGDRKWIVVGIMGSPGSTFDSEIWAKQQLVADRFNKQQYTSIVLRANQDDAAGAKALAYHLRNNFKPRVAATPETEYYAKLQAMNEQLLWGIRFVAVIMAVGGIFGVTNTMFAAISQRIKDIGVLRILGYARWQILISFLLESLAIALLGGLIGCGLGYLVDGAEATSILSSGQGGGKTVVLKLIVDANIIGTGMLFALLMGLIGGFFPAWSAMRLRLLESLR